ncbi:MAG: hypothetical protein EZS28_004171 [Streblomastix strix]|uniref:Uncharacterized protein n=1 Tax=Streblomastix strix TaxID=222440 RepID=A0A5J4WZI6_9EUKA|nr:MAG: hypothetical protein EZS28_004171 [Streblomastix strix]
MISRDKWDKLKGIKWYNKLKEYLSSEENGGGCLSRNDEDEQGFEKDNQMQQGECPKKYLVYIPPPIPEPDFNSEDEGDDYSEISSIPSLNSIEFE